MRASPAPPPIGSGWPFRILERLPARSRRRRGAVEVLLGGAEAAETEALLKDLGVGANALAS